MKLIKKNEYTHIGLLFDGGNHNEIISFLARYGIDFTFSFTKREVPNVKFDLGNLGILEPGDVLVYREQSSAGISGVMVICDTSIEDLFLILEE